VDLGFILQHELPADRLAHGFFDAQHQVLHIFHERWVANIFQIKRQFFGKNFLNVVLLWILVWRVPLFLIAPQDLIRPNQPRGHGKNGPGVIRV
jgi:hypothetical protein